MKKKTQYETIAKLFVFSFVAIPKLFYISPAKSTLEEKHRNMMIFLQIYISYAFLDCWEKIEDLSFTRKKRIDPSDQIYLFRSEKPSLFLFLSPSLLPLLSKLSRLNRFCGLNPDFFSSLLLLIHLPY